MQWNDFKAKVMAHLGYDADDPNPIKQKQVDQYARSAVIRMQEVIPGYQKGHETIYGPDDLARECHAHRGELPDGARPTEFWRHGAVPEDAEDTLVDESDESGDVISASCERRRTEVYPVDWTERTRLIDGTARLHNVIAVNPQRREFYLARTLAEGETLHVFWNGLKTEFAEDETLPWGEEAVDYAAQYAAAQVERSSRDKLNQYETFMADARQSLALLETGMRNR